MRGLWRVGSSWIGGAEGGSKSAHYQFSHDAWARYDNVLADCGANCTVELRFRSAAKPDPFSPPPGAGRTISIALGAPLAANIIATTEQPVSSANWTTLRCIFGSM